MIEEEKLDIVAKIEKNFELNLPEFYKELKKAISTNNRESIYKLSKIFTRYQFKKLDN
ncbi:MAG: hypothetical protein KGD65_04670 [Candidatus Lokiarchaeota archaeon]|nr:hypothetical protein [Candidatus Lokiarchaeota archaeon]